MLRLNIKWLNNNRVPNPGGWSTNKKLAGGGVASAGLGIAGGIAGYSAGSKIGDQNYKTGRNLVTGKKTFKDLRKDINKGVKSVPKKIDKLLSPT